jgi:uncharacterized membrane protein HdeD (DUF308 family)
MRFVSLVFILLGIMAIVEPMVAGLAVAILIGWLLIVGGVAHAVAVFGAGGIGGALWQVVLAIIYLLGGAYFLTHPVLGLGTLTLYLAVILVAEAVLTFIAYVQSRARRTGSAWILANGVITIFLGVMIWDQWPSSSTWAIGTLLGVNLLMTGVASLMIATAVRRLAVTTP